MFKISDESARKELNKMLNSGVIKSKGKGRSLHYILQ